MKSRLAAAASGLIVRAMHQPAAVLPVNKEISDSFVRRIPELLPSHRRLYLLRHGQTEWNERGLIQGGGHDIPLNGHGLGQARCASDAFSSVPLGVVASSHLVRAAGTADALRARHPAAASAVLPDLGEMRFGDFEGMAIHGPESTEDTKERFRLTNELVSGDGDFRWPGENGESTREVEVRARRAVEDVLGRHPGAKHLALVGHGRTNKVLLASLLWGDTAKFTLIKQGNTCINVIDLEELTGTWKPVVINYVDHADVDERYR